MYIDYYILVMIIEDIETGLKGRDKELCKPLLQLFYGCKSQKRIERALEILLDEKKDRKANSLERDMLEVVVDLFEESSRWSYSYFKYMGSIERKNKWSY